ncbi:MAG: TIM barrel protein [Promethearchaeota archaeon]
MKNDQLSAVEILFLNVSLGYTKSSLHYPREESLQNIVPKLAGLAVSIHAPYAMSLTVQDKKSYSTSKAHFTVNLKLGHALGARYIIFHSGSIRKSISKDRTTKEITKRLKEIMLKREERNYSPLPAPEVAGKLGGFADFHTLVLLAEEIGCFLCWDFAHDFVRGGDVGTYEMILKRFTYLENHLELSSHQRLPIHLSGIIGGKRGEKQHTLLDEGDGVPWKLFLTVIKNQGYLEKTTIICESKADQKDLDTRLSDATKIKNFLMSDEEVTSWQAKRTRLDSFF